MKKFKVGIPLDSLREEMEKDMEKTLQRVKEIGYDYVEFAGYFGKSAEEIRALLDKYGLECISVHQGADFYIDGGQNAFDFIKTLGAKYSAIPWYEKEKLAGSDEWENTVALFTKLGEDMKANGLQLLYHNHDFEFNKFEDKYLIDHIYDSIPNNLINPEFDTCWVKYAGEDPIKYIEKYAGRVTVLHLKDFVCKNYAAGPAYALIDNEGNAVESVSKEDNEFRFKPCGHGVQDFKSILEAAEKCGTEYVIVEQDAWYDECPFECAKKSREHLKSLGI